MEEIFILIFSLAVVSSPSWRKYFFTSNQKESTEIKGRQIFFDFIKGLAILAVIIIHVSYFYYHYSSENIFFVNGINNIARFAIPIFFICSGILLDPRLKGKKQITDFYRRKVLRIFIPYFLAVLLIAFANNNSPADFVYNLISGRAAVPYYFIAVLFQLYIIYPLLIRWRHYPTFLYLSFLISLSSYLLPASWYIFGIPLFFKFLFFFNYGIYYRNNFLDRQKTLFSREEYFWLMITAAYLALALFGGDRFYNVRLFYGPAVFSLLWTLRHKINFAGWLGQLIASCGRLSLWIFLLHFFYVWIFFYYWQNLTNCFYLNFLLIFAASSLASYLSAYILSWVYGFVLRLSGANKS